MDTSNATPNAFILQVDDYQFLLDEQDRELAQKRWRAYDQSYPMVYAIWHTTLKKRNASYYLHRLVMERALGRPLEKGEVVDHKNRNTLDCTRGNLRVGTQAQNGQNRGKQSNSKSPYKGVCWDKSRGKWMATITTNGVTTHLGRFTDIEEARKAYESAALQQHGEFARFE